MNATPREIHLYDELARHRTLSAEAIYPALGVVREDGTLESGERMRVTTLRLTSANNDNATLAKGLERACALFVARLQSSGTASQGYLDWQTNVLPRLTAEPPLRGDTTLMAPAQYADDTPPDKRNHLQLYSSQALLTIPGRVEHSLELELLWMGRALPNSEIHRRMLPHVSMLGRKLHAAFAFFAQMLESGKYTGSAAYAPNLVHYLPRDMSMSSTNFRWLVPVPPKTRGETGTWELRPATIRESEMLITERERLEALNNAWREKYGNNVPPAFRNATFAQRGGFIDGLFLPLDYFSGQVAADRVLAQGLAAGKGVVEIATEILTGVHRDRPGSVPAFALAETEFTTSTPLGAAASWTRLQALWEAIGMTIDVVVTRVGERSHLMPAGSFRGYQSLVESAIRPTRELLRGWTDIRAARAAWVQGCERSTGGEAILVQTDAFAACELAARLLMIFVHAPNRRATLTLRPALLLCALTRAALLPTSPISPAHERQWLPRLFREFFSESQLNMIPDAYWTAQETWAGRYTAARTPLQDPAASILVQMMQTDGLTGIGTGTGSGTGTTGIQLPRRAADSLLFGPQSEAFANGAAETMRGRRPRQRPRWT